MKIESRHLAFIGLAVVVVIAMLVGGRPDLTPSADSVRMHEYIASLAPGSVVMVSFDHEASSLPEIGPLAKAFLRHAFSRGVKLVGVSLLAEGTGIGYRLMEETGREYDCEYGKDFVFLGFKPQWVAAIVAMGESISKTYPEDYLGNTYQDIPMLAGVVNYSDVAGVVSIADGSLTTHWMEYGHARYGITVSAFVAAAMVTTYDPYLASGQMHAMVGGLRGAAEYESLIGVGGSGGRAMLAQTVAHLYVIVLIILGNVVYFRSRHTGRK
ncbi:MAG: hypothetical protein JSU65_09605 [Candidatus Zixiibacteriota bacterium]|nr:MAG: hypothetical protein JSU65_09605 [candidate division Zixibacteria bacterium]